MESEFPSNANKQKIPKPAKGLPEKKIEQVTTGKVIQRKKSLSKRFMETFTGDDSRSVLGYVFVDIMIPGIKDIVADVVSQGVERKLFGEARSTSRRGRGYGLSGGHSAYNRMYSGPPGLGRREEPRTTSHRSRATHNFDEIVLETRAEATEVIDQLYTLISQYEIATVADLYGMVGFTASFTDEKYGWTDIRGADVTRVRDGYLLDLPKPEPID